MPDSKNSKNYKLISIIIILCVADSYIGILYLVNMFAGSFGLVHFLNSKNILKNHRTELIKKIERDPHFADINVDDYVKEMEKIISMDKKRHLGDWISFRSFTPNISGTYINTNDYGMRSKWDLIEMVQRAKKNQNEGIKNIIILGGSVAFGYGAINDKKTISSFLDNMLKEDGYEVFNLAQGGYTSFMDLFSLSTMGLYLEPNIIIVMEGYADTLQLAYQSKGGDLAWGLFSGSDKNLDPEFALGFHYQNLTTMLGLGNILNRQVILALQPLSGFENNSTIENEEIKKMWNFYPRIREIMKLAASNNGAKFVDLSVIFKDDSNASIPSDTDRKSSIPGNTEKKHNGGNPISPSTLGDAQTGKLKSILSDNPDVLKAVFYKISALPTGDTSSGDQRDILQEALELVGANLREDPALPGDPSDAEQADQDALREDAAIELQPAHCAFLGCARTFASGCELSNHLQSDAGHVKALSAVTRCMAPSRDSEEVRGFSAYCEAIAWKIRQGAPLDTYSIDRRAVRQYNMATADDQVYMPMCFSCARRFPHVASLDKLDQKPKNAIRWQKPISLTEGVKFFGMDARRCADIFGRLLNKDG